MSFGSDKRTHISANDGIADHSHSSIPTHLDFIDIITGIAIIRVVFIHALADYCSFVLHISPAFHLLPNWAKILDLCLRYNVPIFVFLAGFKFHLSSHRHAARLKSRYIASRFYRLGIPLLIWTGIYYLSKGLFFPGTRAQNPLYSTFPLPDFKQIYQMISGIQNPGFHLWFITMLLIVQIVYPLVTTACKRKDTAAAISGLVCGLSIFLRLPAPFSFVEYFFVYHLGVIFADAAYFNRRPVMIRLVGFTSLGLVLAVSCIRFYYPQLWYLNKVLMVCISPAFFIVFSSIRSVRPFKIFQRIGKETWGIYIVHEPMIQSGIMLCLTHKLGITSPGAIGLSGCITLFTSYVLIKGFKKFRLYDLLF
jgi:peptidoglycan/LPS O-acetylase OafA/YrhL